MSSKSMTLDGESFRALVTLVDSLWEGESPEFDPGIVDGFALVRPFTVALDDIPTCTVTFNADGGVTING